MAERALVDIRDAGGAVYLFKKGSLPSVVPIKTNPAGGFEAPGLFAGIEECVLSVPLSMLDFRFLELPLSDPEKARETLPFELEGLVLGRVEDLVIDAIIVGPTAAGDGYNVLAVYMRKAVLADVLGGLLSLGIDPRAVTSVELCLAVKAGGGAEGIAARLLEAPDFAEEARLMQAEREAASPTMNLRRGALAYAKDAERTRRSLTMTAALVLAVLVMFGAYTALRLLDTKKELSLAEKTVIKTYTEMFQGERPSDARGLLMKARARVKEAADKEATLRGASVLEFLMKLQQAARPGMKVTELTVDRGAVVIKGEASSLSRVEEMKGLLEGFLSGVKITEVSKSASGETSFTISGKEAGA